MTTRTYSLLALLALQWGVIKAAPILHDTAEPVSIPTPVGDLGDLQPRAASPQAAACTYTPEQTVPTDIPTASPYVSQAGWNYYPMGSQNGMILSGSYDGLWVQGPATFPESNSFSLAVEQCSAACDSDLACLSFNVLTANEGDFNNCLPTFECRFSSSVYKPSDYTLDNGLPSYVWSLQATDAPNCALTSDSQISPETWTNLGMDQYLNSVARINGIYGETSNFAMDLMSALGYVGFGCTDDQANCPSPQITNCAEYLYYQIAAYEGYMANNEKMFNDILLRVTTTGTSIYNELWWTGGAPSGTQWNPTSAVEGIFNGVLGLIPEIGGVLKAIASVLEALLDSTNTGPVLVVPNEASTWSAFMNSITTQVDNAMSSINTMSRSATQSNALFSQVTQGGTWSIEDTSSPAVRPDISEVWGQVGPYYAAKIAMQAMQSQSVFFMSVPVSLLDGNTACTQAVADNFASYFSGSASGVAWCANSGQVIIPILGWNMNVYTNFPTVATLSNQTIGTILESSSTCYPGFGLNGNNGIHLYNSPAQLPADQQSSALYFDMLRPCAWSVPICDYGAWSAQMATQQASGTPEFYSPSNGERLTNTAIYCAYNFGFISETQFCGDVTMQVPFGHVTEPRTYDMCTEWAPSKVMQISS
ncbi:hypothetical protein MMC27_003753 [Xylographa pallens]|nr:hypothetical protein [Xylographa pallens]